MKNYRHMSQHSRVRDTAHLDAQMVEAEIEALHLGFEAAESRYAAEEERQAQFEFLRSFEEPDDFEEGCDSELRYPD